MTRCFRVQNLCHGAFIDTKSQTKPSPVTSASRSAVARAHDAVVEMFLDAGADVSS
jgi:hypothetical protein